MTLDLAAINAVVAFSLEEAAAGGHIACFVVGVPADVAGLFGNAVPLSQAQAQLIAAEIHSAIVLDWSASGKKTARTYQITIRDKNQNVRTERRIACTPEEIKPEDVMGSAIHVGIAALNAASSAMNVPFQRLEGIIDRQAAVIEDYKGELAAARGRIHELEAERRGAVDQVNAYLKTESEGRLHGAQAEAALAEGRAKAAMYDSFGKAALVNAPTVLAIGAKLAGLTLNRPPPGLARAAGALASAAPELASAMGLKPGGAPAPAASASTLSEPSPAAIAALRSFAATLTDKEVGRLLKWAYGNASGETIGAALQQLGPEHKTGAIGLLDHLPKDWQ